MHGWETRMLLRHSLQRGVSKAALARRFGVSRRTIHEWVETGQLDRDLSSGGAREQIESLHELGFLDRRENVRDDVSCSARLGWARRIWRSAWRSRPPRPADASTTGRWRD